MNMSINQTDPIRSFSRMTSAGEHSVEIRLDPLRAAQWLVCVEELLTHGESPELEQFHGELSDACWLARWKREAPWLNVDGLVLPALAAALMSEAALAGCRVRIVEDIISSLSGCRLSQ